MKGDEDDYDGWDTPDEDDGDVHEQYVRDE